MDSVVINVGPYIIEFVRMLPNETLWDVWFTEAHGEQHLYESWWEEAGPATDDSLNRSLNYRACTEGRDYVAEVRAQLG